MSKSTRTEIFNYIRWFNEVNGNFPTLVEIGNAVNVSAVSTVHGHLSRLVSEGLITKHGTSYKFSDRNNMTSVPIVGTITAGAPIMAVELDDPETITVTNLPLNGTFYALTVSGDSMIDDGIFDGDIVIIKKQSSAQNGQTVVAIIDDDQTTLKRIYRDEGKKQFRLQPANQSMLPIYRDEVEIRGIVWEIRRNYQHAETEGDFISTKTWRTLDLFAGIGGIRLGFEKAGFKTVFANDFEKNCKHTYDLNFPSAKLVVEDITKIKVDDLPDFDFLLGGFPCQAFSIAGYRKGFEDEKGRGNLFFDIARILESRKPEGFLLENVKNLKSHDGGNTFKVIEHTLRELGYSTKHKVLNSMEYGDVPQNRERIYIVGFRDAKKTEAFEFPQPIKLTKNITDILETDVDNKYYYNDKPLYDKIKNDINEVGQVYQWRRQYVRKNKKGVCPTLTANMGMGGHNVPIIFDGKGIRKLTPRECARIQGYPDSYKLPSIADSALYKQIGNSVTVPVLERIAQQMMRVL